MSRCTLCTFSFFTESLSQPVRAVLIGISVVFALLLGSEPGLGQGIGESRTLPAEFRAHRIYVHPVTERGDTLELYTDTGGGRLPLIAESAVETYDLSIADTVQRAGRELPVVSFPEFSSETSIPSGPTGRFFVYPFGRRAKMTGLQDGLLGSGWFDGRVWTFDYGKDALILRGDPDEIDWSPPHTVSLGFKPDSTGERANSFVSAEARIGGTTYAFLFDTGATAVLTEKGRERLGGPTRQATSFVTTSLLERWTSEHPDWSVIEGASQFPTSPRMIRVPELTIAGHSVGPVWFEERPDRAFHGAMSDRLGHRVEGALGGSLFKYFRITVDYPRGRALFEGVDRDPAGS